MTHAAKTKVVNAVCSTCLVRMLISWFPIKLAFVLNASHRQRFLGRAVRSDKNVRRTPIFWCTATEDFTPCPRRRRGFVTRMP
jgi:hypothetical protein